MTQFLFTNQPSSSLLNACQAGDTLLLLTTGGGSVFPTPGAGQVFALVLSDGNAFEVCYVTERTADALTVERAQEGTVAAAWPVGTLAQLLVTAGTLEAFLQAVPQGGWAAPTGTLARTTFNTATVTLEQLAEVVAALVTDGLAGGTLE